MTVYYIGEKILVFEFSVYQQFSYDTESKVNDPIINLILVYQINRQYNISELMQIMFLKT